MKFIVLFNNILVRVLSTLILNITNDKLPHIHFGLIFFHLIFALNMINENKEDY